MPATSEAIVAKPGLTDVSPSRYLLITPAGAAIWVDDAEAATAFVSMREATRMAMRLPSAVKAFGLPREPELAVQRLH
jgi:hypothetical protein